MVALWQPGALSALDAAYIDESEDVGATGVFSAVVDGQTLTFSRDGGEDAPITDAETGSTWDVTGRAIDGPLAGTRLDARSTTATTSGSPGPPSCPTPASGPPTASISLGDEAWPTDGTRATLCRPIESVWDYPRPPTRRSRPTVACVSSSTAPSSPTHDERVRVLETSHPPAGTSRPRTCARTCCGRPAASTACEFKGDAGYFDICAGGRERRGRGLDLRPAAARLRGHRRLHRLLPRSGRRGLGRRRARAVPQAGDFYGGWITPEVTGPFKGGPGTRGW